MPLAAALFLMAGAPFWETKPPQYWTDAELSRIFHNSPWAQLAQAPPEQPEAPACQLYLAGAKPMRDAEEEVARRRALRSRPEESPLEEEYRAFLRENEGKQIVLAIYAPNREIYSNAEETRLMQKESVMEIGRRKYRMSVNFPPTRNDPYVRLVFPRELRQSDKTLIFELYIPGLPGPYREVEFAVKDLVFRGEPAF